MIKLALNFICKNESHIIIKMLNSVKPITDLIVAVDTGSADNTIHIIKEFGKKHSIPTFVYDRTFDNFCNSRNYALEMLKEAINLLEWDAENTWGFFVDCDEQMIISEQFKKTALSKDIYLVQVLSDKISFLRQLFFRLSKKYIWEGPIHEILVWDDHDITKQISTDIYIRCYNKGASWKDNPENKFLNYAQKLTQYVEEGNNTFRWVYYIANSYTAAAKHCASKARKKELLHLAKEYYEKALALEGNINEEKYIILNEIAKNKQFLDLEWADIQETYLEVYALDPRRAEPIAEIIEYYMSERAWETAYFFSYFAKNNFHALKPSSMDISLIDESLYHWKLLLHYYICCYHTGRKKEAILLYTQLKELTQSHPGYFENRDLLHIQSHSPINLKIRNWFSWRKMPPSKYKSN